MWSRTVVANKYWVSVYLWIRFREIFCLKQRRFDCSLSMNRFCIANIAVLCEWFFMLWTVWVLHKKEKQNEKWKSIAAKPIRLHWTFCVGKLKSAYLLWLLLSKRWLTDCFLFVTRLCRIIAATNGFVQKYDNWIDDIVYVPENWENLLVMPKIEMILHFCYTQYNKTRILYTIDECKKKKENEIR